MSELTHVRRDVPQARQEQAPEPSWMHELMFDPAVSIRPIREQREDARANDHLPKLNITNDHGHNIGETIAKYAVEGAVGGAIGTAAGKLASAYSPEMRHAAHTAGAVGSELLKGGWDEIKEHPGKVLGTAALAAAGTVALGAATPVAATVAGIVGTGAALGYAYSKRHEIIDGVKDFAHDVATMHDASHKSLAEINAAKADLHHIGAGGSYVAAALAGSAAAAGARAVIGQIAASNVSVGDTVSVTAKGRSDTVLDAFTNGRQYQVVAADKKWVSLQDANGMGFTTARSTFAKGHLVAH